MSEQDTIAVIAGRTSRRPVTTFDLREAQVDSVRGSLAGRANETRRLSPADRRPYRTAQDYRGWIAQMADIARHFREQTDEMRRGLHRGLTPPRVTLKGRDASLTAVTEAAPEASLFWLGTDPGPYPICRRHI